MPFEIQLAIAKDGEQICAKLCDKSMGPFTCVVCNLEVTHRAGLKTPRHFIHKVRSKCIGNGIAHRIIADGMEEEAAGVKEPDYTYNGIPDIPTVFVECEEEKQEWLEKHEEWVDESEVVETTEEPVVVETTEDPVVVETTKEPVAVETTEEPVVVETTEEPVVVETTEEPVVVETTEEPIVVETIEEPVVVGSTEEPVVVESIEEPVSILDDELNFSEIEKELDAIIDSCVEESSVEISPIVENDLKCTDCKKKGTGYFKMFGDEITEKFSLHDIYVCPVCMVKCKHCNGVNSIKRERRYGMCFECDDIKTTWVALSRLAINEMRTIPNCPLWLENEKHDASVELIRRKSMGRKISRFFMSHRTHIKGYKKTMVNIYVDKVKLKMLEKKRKDESKIKIKNQKARDRSRGPDATMRYNRMYDNKKQLCVGCNSYGKRRNMNRYESIMGDVRWSCKSCVQVCPECSKSCIENETKKQNGLCFDCYCWKVGDERWLKNYRGVVQSASTGDIESCAILFRNAPFVNSGQYGGERISNIPTSELDSIVRNTHPELEKIVSVIKICRKI